MCDTKTARLSVLLAGAALLTGCADGAIVTSRPIVASEAPTMTELRLAADRRQQAALDLADMRHEYCVARHILQSFTRVDVPADDYPDGVSAADCPTPVTAAVPAGAVLANLQQEFEDRAAAFIAAQGEVIAADESYEQSATRVADQILSSDPPLDRLVGSQSAGEAASQSDAPYGLAYFLPRQLATVTVRRTPSKVAKAVTGVTRTQAAFDTATTALADRRREEAAARDALNAGSDRSVTLNLLDQSFREAQDARRAAEQAVDRANTALDAAKVKLASESAAAVTARNASSMGAGQFDVTLSITLNPPTADPAYAFRLNPRHSGFRDDEHKFTVGSNGLLTSANVVSVDRTGDVLVELATFAGAVMGNPTLSLSGAAGSTIRCNPGQDEFTGLVDFANLGDVDRLNAQLFCLGVQLTVNDPPALMPSLPGQSQTSAQLEGIVYRSPAERVVTVKRCASEANYCGDGRNWMATQQLSFVLPQAGPVSVLRQDADALTRTSYDIAFDNGVPTSFSSNRPSTALELARLPIRAVEGVFNGISRIISLRIGQANSQTALSTAQLNLLNQQTQYDLAVASSQQQLAIQELNNQQALALAGFTNQQALVTAQQQLAAAQAQFAQAQVAAQQALALAGVNNQTSLAQAQQQLANTQTQNSIAQLGAPGQIASAQFAAEVAALREQNLRAQLERCVAGVIAATPAGSTPDIAPCLAGL